MGSNEAPFADLPAALVEEVLGHTSEVGDKLLDTFQHLKSKKESMRKELRDSGIVLNDASLGSPPAPTTCATDGSYAIERLLTVDLVAAAAVAMEGLTPPSEKRHWSEPYHKTFVTAETHRMETTTILRAVMLGNELLLATQAPHELVMIDGSYTLPIIYFNQAVNTAPNINNLKCAEEFLNNCIAYLEAYLILLESERSDRQFIALPKYSTRREIGRKLKWDKEHDDRGLLTMLLEPGEYTNPLSLEKPNQSWHLNLNNLPTEIQDKAIEISKHIVDALDDIHIIYYKPHDWLPALRIEVAAAVAKNKNRLSIVLRGIKEQCATGAMLEPYPIYLADRTVKSLARALPAFRQVATQRISEKYDGDIGEVFFAMHGYRTESGA